MQEPHFEALEVLGEGSSGKVQRARLLEPFGELPAGSEVAIKTLSPELRGDPLALEAMAAELAAGQLVADPSLVSVLHRGEGPNGPYLLLSYVPGRTLEEIIDEEGSLPEPLVRSVALQLASALSALHAADIVHGDVKPENIRLDAEGRAVLLDLGFALHVDHEGTTHAGTLAYLSPERAQGGAPSPAADIWALGVTLFELSTGAHPLIAMRRRPGHTASLLARSSGRLFPRTADLPEMDDFLVALATKRTKPPSSLVPTLSPFIDAVIYACLRRAEHDRIDGTTLVDALAGGEGSEWWRARVKGATASGAARAGAGGVEDLPLVGRRDELEQLLSLWGEVSQVAPGEPGAGAIVWLVGSDGAGKWRLVHELAARARLGSAPPVHLAVRWRNPSESRPGGAILEWLAHWLELPPGTAPGPHELERLLQHAPPDAARTLFAALSPTGDAELDGSVPVALGTWAKSLSQEQPLLLVLDDMQRAGAVTYEALSKFLGRLTSGRIMVVLSCREDVPADEPELFENLWTLLERRSREGQGREMSIRRIQLGPVDEAALAELVALLFHRSTPRKRIARALWNSSGGNPGLASEVLRELVRRGEAVPAGDDDGKLMLLVAPDDLPQPRSLDRLLAERLSVLAAEDRTWLERLAVLGGRIDPALLLLTGVAATHAELDPVLGRLVRLGWLLPIGNRYRFERPALRDAVYRGLSQGRRARLHLDIAHALEDAGSDSTDDAFTRAYHLRMAREDEELLAYLLPLIKRLRYRASAERLFTLSVWGLDALDVLASTPEHDTYRLTLLEDASDAADRLGRREAQRRLLDRLTDLELDPARMPLLAARVYLLHGRYAGSTGQLGLARGMFRNAREFAFAAHDDALISESTRRLAHVQGQVGELVAAQGLAERALLTATTPDQTALAELELAVFKLLDDRIEDALEGVDRAFAALRETDEVHHGIQAQAYLVRCRAWRAAGRPDRANAAIRRSLKLARRAGEGQLESEAHARLGVSLVDLDRAEEAEQELRDALLSSDEIEDRRGQVLGNVFLAMLLWEEDDVSARAGLVLAIRQATDVGFYRAEALARAILARLEHAHGNLAAADRESELSFTLMESHGSELGDRIAITGTRAMVLNSIQRGWESRSIVRALRRRMRQANRRLTDRSLQRNQRVYSTDLLEAVLSPEGHIFPRAKRSSVRDDSTFDDE